MNVMVGERHERFAMDRAGAEALPPTMPIYVRPAIHPDPAETRRLARIARVRALHDRFWRTVGAAPPAQACTTFVLGLVAIFVLIHLMMAIFAPAAVTP